MLPLPLLEGKFLFVAVKRACLHACIELPLSTGLSGQQLSRAQTFSTSCYYKDEIQSIAPDTDLKKNQPAFFFPVCQCPDSLKS